MAAVRDTALQVTPPLAGEDIMPNSEAEVLNALREAVTAPWVEGLQLRGETVRNIYAGRLLTANAVEVAKLASRGMAVEEVESLLADSDPCLLRHDSRGTVALLDWLGRGKAKPVFARLLHGLLRTAGGKHPPEHTRASVEAVECLLSSCPRLAQASLHLEQLGLSSASSTGGADSPASAASGRLLPLQTLCLCCEAATAHTVSIARALLRRVPEACSRPLPRVLRRNVRGGGGYAVFVGDATAMLQHRCLAAEEAGRDSAVLRELLRVLQSQVDANAKAGLKTGGPPAAPCAAIPEPPPATPRPPATPPSGRSARQRPRAGPAAAGGAAATQLRTPATLTQLIAARASGLPPLALSMAGGEASAGSSPGLLSASVGSVGEAPGLHAWRCAASRCPVEAATLPAIGAR